MHKVKFNAQFIYGKCAQEDKLIAVQPSNVQGGGGSKGGGCHPPKVLKHQHLMFSVAVRLSLARRQVQ